MCSSGSSPHARGAQFLKCCARYAYRIIPACAGSTFGPASGGMRGGDHPRMRGEHHTLPMSTQLHEGSSPHARGARLRCPGTPKGRGIIPACAGSTFSISVLCIVLRDHPRMRGEHWDDDSSNTAKEGSSPHARGALGRRFEQHGEGGIIPACAGSTDLKVISRRDLRDHPRMRGEHLSAMSVIHAPAGSSPHARGARGAVSVPIDAAGIIPACAGSTPAQRPQVAHNRDHPRMRGEHLSTSPVSWL